jgi:hypothetical protein
MLVFISSQGDKKTFCFYFSIILLSDANQPNTDKNVLCIRCKEGDLTMERRFNEYNVFHKNLCLL